MLHPSVKTFWTLAEMHKSQNIKPNLESYLNQFLLNFQLMLNLRFGVDGLTILTELDAWAGGVECSDPELEEKPNIDNFWILDWQGSEATSLRFPILTRQMSKINGVHGQARLSYLYRSALDIKEN